MYQVFFDQIYSNKVFLTPNFDFASKVTACGGESYYIPRARTPTHAELVVPATSPLTLFRFLFIYLLIKTLILVFFLPKFTITCNPLITSNSHLFPSLYHTYIHRGSLINQLIIKKEIKEDEEKRSRIPAASSPEIVESVLVNIVWTSCVTLHSSFKP